LDGRNLLQPQRREREPIDRAPRLGFDDSFRLIPWRQEWATYLAAAAKSCVIEVCEVVCFMTMRPWEGEREIFFVLAEQSKDPSRPRGNSK